MDFLRETEASLFLFAVLEKEVDFSPVQSDVWHTKTEGGTNMGHSTSSGRVAATTPTSTPAAPTTTTPAAPRYEMPVDFRSDVPSIVRNLNQRLSIVNDTSDMDVVRRGDDEYEVTRQWQESAPNGGYYSRRETTTMNRGQVVRAVRREVSERSTVRLGNETLLRYRRNRG